MAQKLLLFWRKPARRCWWEGVELENVDGIEGKLKVWIRRVWTLEMVRWSTSFLLRELTLRTECYRLTIGPVALFGVVNGLREGEPVTKVYNIGEWEEHCMLSIHTSVS